MWRVDRPELIYDKKSDSPEPDFLRDLRMFLLLNLFDGVNNLTAWSLDGGAVADLLVQERLANWGLIRNLAFERVSLNRANDSVAHGLTLVRLQDNCHANSNFAGLGVFNDACVLQDFFDF